MTIKELPTVNFDSNPGMMSLNSFIQRIPKSSRIEVSFPTLGVL